MYHNEEFIKEIFNYFINDLSKYTVNNIIKKHTEKLQEYGDYSFPINIQNWSRYVFPLEYSGCKNIFSYRELKFGCKFQSITEHIDDLVERSKQWPLQIRSGKIDESRCSIYLNRSATFYSIISTVLNDPDYGCAEQNQSYAIIRNNRPSEEKEFLTKYRCRIVEDVIENLIKNSRGLENVTPPGLLYVTHKSTDPDAPLASTQIFVGIVTSSDKKMSNITADEYIKKRSLDMQLMAQHKYGLRVKNEKFFQVLIEALGKAAVTIDLLEVKHSCSVKLIMSGCTGRSKGASFIMYNSARIETLLKKYNHGVATKFYPETPPFEDVNLDLLKEEEEWSLLFNFILAYPSVIGQTIGEFGKTRFSLHFLCIFLSGLASTFSIYYARTRILTECRQQLIPTLQARIYLLKCLRIVLNKCLAMLNIAPVEQM